MNVLAELRGRFRSALAPLADAPESYLDMVRIAQDERFGDFQANCAMPLAKSRKTNPRQLADQIVAALDVTDICSEPSVAGPGFINLRLRDDWLESAVNRMTADPRLGVERVQSPRKVVIDYSAPNVAKPMHVGHLRSTVIGAALYHILTFLGHHVTGDNHIGDWGTQFGMIIYGYKNFCDPRAYDDHAVDELARLYRLVNQLAEYQQAIASLPALEQELDQKNIEIDSHAGSKGDAAKKQLKKLRTDAQKLSEEIGKCRRRRDAVEGDPEVKGLATAHPDIAGKARKETARLHAGDPENTALWSEFLPKCLDAIQRVYDRLDVRFDLTLGESYYQPKLAHVVDSLLKQKIAVESAGAICVFVDENDAPFIIRKGDGAFTYATTDLATIQHRVEDHDADLILYVVDARQSEHFSLLFATARRWGYDQTEYRHVSFGTVLGDDKRPFRTREGDTVGLESLIDEAVARARRIVDENDDAKEKPELDDAERSRVAEIVGIAAIKYADLRHNRESDYIFDWDKMLATTGDTATYMQYAYARICGIFRKGNVDREALQSASGSIRFTAPEERALAFQLVRFSEVIDDVADDLRPNLLTQYLFELAKRFSAFFDNCPVIQAKEEAVRTSRLLLCDLTGRVVKQGLSLLGIRTSERM